MNKVPMWQDPNESPLVRELLQSGRAMRAYDYDVEAGLAKHLSLVDAGAPLPDWAEPLVSKTAATGAVATSGVSGLVLTSVAVGVIGAVTGIYVAMSRPEPPAEPPQRQVQMAPASDSVSGQAIDDGSDGHAGEVEVEAQWERVHRRRPQRRQAGQGQATGERRHAQAPQPQVERPRSTPVAQGSVDLAAQPAETASGGAASATSAKTSSSSRKVAPTSSGPARQRAVAARPAPEPKAVEIAPRPAAEEVVVDDMRLEREMRMLKVTQESLESDPKRALRLAEAGEKEFPGSLFTQERQYLLIAALSKLGRIEDARKRATVYLRTYPSGPFSDRVQAALKTD